MRPRDLCAALLRALEASEGRRRRRLRDSTPDALGLAIKRDARFPIRITVQFYKATSNGVVGTSEMKMIADQIGAVYADAKAVGSLVCEPDRGRSTEWDDDGKGKVQPSDWWERFWEKQEQATGKTRAQLLHQLELLLGRRPTESELEAALRRVFKD